MTTAISNLSATWSNSSITYNAISMNVSNTGANNQSALLNFAVNGNNVFRISGDGRLRIGAANNFTVANPSVSGGAYAERVFNIVDRGPTLKIAAIDSDTGIELVRYNTAVNAVTTFMALYGVANSLIIQDRTTGPAYTLMNVTNTLITFNRDTNISGNVNATGTISATSFIGSGALLTGISSAGRLVRITSYTSGNNIWTKPSDVTKVMVIVTGAGGGGYSADLGLEPSGGSAGGTAIKYIDVTNISSAYCNVGSGGAVSSNGNDSQWDDGTNTLVGVKGLGTASTGGKLGGAATGGDINITGGSGGAGRASSGFSTHGNAGASYWGGAGAYGSGGNPGSYNVQITGSGGIIVIFEYS